MKRDGERDARVQAAVESFIGSGRGRCREAKRTAFRRYRAAGLVPLFAAEAKEREHAGKSADGQAGGRGRKKPSGNSAPGFSDRAPRARDEAGAAVGVSGRKVRGPS
jgi:hypothetical protein